MPPNPILPQGCITPPGIPMSPPMPGQNQAGGAAGQGPMAGQCFPGGHASRHELWAVSTGRHAWSGNGLWSVWSVFGRHAWSGNGLWPVWSIFGAACQGMGYVSMVRLRVREPTLLAARGREHGFPSCLSSDSPGRVARGDKFTAAVRAAGRRCRRGALPGGIVNAGYTGGYPGGSAVPWLTRCGLWYWRMPVAGCGTGGMQGAGCGTGGMQGARRKLGGSRVRLCARRHAGCRLWHWRHGRVAAVALAACRVAAVALAACRVPAMAGGGMRVLLAACSGRLGTGGMQGGAAGQGVLASPVGMDWAVQDRCRQSRGRWWYGGTNGRNGRRGSRRYSIRTEPKFASPGPVGMKVTWFAPDCEGKAYPNQYMDVPGRYNFAQAAIYHLKLFDIPNRLGLVLYPTLEVVPANSPDG